MSFKKEFENELQELFERRTYWLRTNLFTRKPGKPRVLSRHVINQKINMMQEIASAALARDLAKEEFRKCVYENKIWFVKGHGITEKKHLFDEWINGYNQDVDNFVYIFWNIGSRCIYVGRTRQGGLRPTHHFIKHWFKEVKRITIYLTWSSKDLPKLECLAIHHFQPTRNKQKAATKKWTSKCPLCEIHRYIEDELRLIFKLKR